MSMGGGNDRNTGGYGAGGYSGGYSGLPPSGAVNRVSSQPPVTNGGFARSNYTASEAAESDFDTHSQFQKRK